MLPTKFQVNWRFGSGEAKNRFWPSRFLIIPILAIFGSTSHPDASYQDSSQLAFRFRRSEKEIFKMVPTVAILDF